MISCIKRVSRGGISILIRIYQNQLISCSITMQGSADFLSIFSSPFFLVPITIYYRKLYFKHKMYKYQHFAGIKIRFLPIIS